MCFGDANIIFYYTGAVILLATVMLEILRRFGDPKKPNPSQIRGLEINLLAISIMLLISGYFMSFLMC